MTVCVVQWTMPRMSRRAGLCRRCSGWPVGSGSPSTTVCGRCRCAGVWPASHPVVLCSTISFSWHNLFLCCLDILVSNNCCIIKPALAVQALLDRQRPSELPLLPSEAALCLQQQQADTRAGSSSGAQPAAPPTKGRRGRPRKSGAAAAGAAEAPLVDGPPTAAADDADVSRCVSEKRSSITT